MAYIIVNGPVNCSLINFLYLGTLEFDDNDPSLPKRTHKFLLDLRHCKGTSILNTNRYVISIKISVVRLTSVVVHTSHAGDAWRFSGGQNSSNIIDVRVVGLLTWFRNNLHRVKRRRVHCGLPRNFPRTNKVTIT